MREYARRATRRGNRAVVLAVLGAAAVVLVVLVLRALLSASTVAPVRAPAGRAVTVARAAVTQPLPGGFLGLSFEFRGLEEYAGSDPSALDPVFGQLIRNLAPGQRPVIRIGGDSTDWTWWPVPHMHAPGGVHYGLGTGWSRVAAALAHTLGARLILGVNFEADSRRIAAREANMMVNTIGAASIAALELGNEPELYGSFAWYRTPAGQAVPGRASGYGPTEFTSDFGHVASALPRVPLAGPATGSARFLSDLGAFLDGNPRVRLVTVHAYPLEHCVATNVPTIAELLAPKAITSLAATVGATVAVAHRHRASLRLDEFNSVSCGGYRPVTASFGAALWALEELFALDRAGVDGVNVHTIPNTTQHLITVQKSGGHWTGAVLPEYYGLLAFADAAPAGSRLLRTSGSAAGGVQVDATETRGTVRVTLVNTARNARWITLRVPGLAGPLTGVALQAASLAAQGGVTLGGQSIDPSTGALGGHPRVSRLLATGGSYRVRVAGTSALLLTPAARTA